MRKFAAKLDKTELMKQINKLCLLLAVIVCLVSCKAKDSTETTLYSDAVITGFTLGSFNQYTPVETADTAYTEKTVLSGSNYQFTIDQLNRQIYNADSLPVGTDAKHLLCTVTTLNNGYITLRDTTQAGAYYYFSSSDSIDFSFPRIIRIYATDGEGFTDYTVRVNVHKEVGDAFVWQLTDTEWTPSEQPQMPAGIQQLLGGSTTEQYAMSESGKLMVSFDNGSTWQEDNVEDDEELLPTTDLALVSYPMYLADSTDYVVLVGNRAPVDYTADGQAMVWRKVVDYSSTAPAGKWVCIERASTEPYLLPQLKDFSLVRYDERILAFGYPYEEIYESRDNGITWQESSLVTMPEDFDAKDGKVLVTVDANQYIWLRCVGTGQVWRGRLNRLGWETKK